MATSPLPLQRPVQAAHHGHIKVDVIPSAEGIDADGWARSYVLAVLRLEGWRPPAAPTVENTPS